jgi:hypothetical protein
MLPGLKSAKALIYLSATSWISCSNALRFAAAREGRNFIVVSCAYTLDFKPGGSAPTLQRFRSEVVRGQDLLSSCPGFGRICGLNANSAS